MKAWDDRWVNQAHPINEPPPGRYDGLIASAVLAGQVVILWVLVYSIAVLLAS